MKKIICILFAVFSLFPFSVRAADAPPDWEDIINHFNLLVTSYAELVDSKFSNVETYLAEHREKLKISEQQISEYRILLSSYNNESGFEALLRCRQIRDFKADFDAEQLFIESSLKRIDETAGSVAALLTELEENKRNIPSKCDSARENVLLEGNSLLISCSRLRSMIEDYLVEYDRTKVRIDKLYGESVLLREQVVDSMFSNTESGRWSKIMLNFSVTRISDVLHLWVVNAVDWAKLQIPRTKAFWFKFGWLCLLVLLPLTWWARSYWYGKFVEWQILENEPAKRWYFTTGVFFGLMSAIFYLSVIWLSGSEESTFITFAETLRSFAFLILALTFRLSVEDARRSFRLYMPVIVQNLFGLFFYISLADNFVLSLMLVPLNLVMAIWILILLIRIKYPPIDLYLGVLSFIAALSAMALAMFNFPYISFTITMGYFIFISQVQMAIVLTISLYNYSAEKRDLAFHGVIIRHLLVPGLWVWTLVLTSRWIIGTYRLQEAFEKWFVTDIRLPSDFFVVTPNRIFWLILTGFILQFVIRMGMELFNKRYNESSDFGLVSSFVTLTTYGLWTLYVLSILVVLNVKYSSLLVLIGGLSMGIGFALKGVLENFFSSVAILMGQQVRNGDLIEFGSVLGKVKKIGLRSSIIETNDGAVVTVPNSSIIEKEFYNWTKNHPYRVVSIEIDVAYGSDLKQAADILKSVMEEMPNIQRHPAPVVLCSNFEASSIRFKMRFWVTLDSVGTTSSAIRLRIAERFAEAKIEIPFNQLDVHLVPVAETAAIPVS